MRISDWSSDVCSSDLGKPRARRGRDEGEQQRGEHRVNPQIDDEPQMLPRRQDEPFERAETEIVRGPEGTETLRIAVLRHQFDPRLRRNDDHHPEGERDQQPRATRLRSEERRVGKECVSTVRYWWTSQN